ncbi:hypothetical protein C4D60_Mb00t01160 [Musa balbisiana]|uniref:Uncharacterized protein n=1 Tax=Musa balbisiana TaxID=52838 RepID=A0A4S8I688_MUSBA|nr:hypothetical protein C4D60_Mb00t01160 [Musa balbisiana]
MTSPSMPCGNDSSGITTFTTTMLSIDQIISWIGFHLTVYGSIACARGGIYGTTSIQILDRRIERDIERDQEFSLFLRFVDQIHFFPSRTLYETF